MNQDPNNLNQNNLNTQGNNGISNDQPLQNNQRLNMFNQNSNINQPINSQPMNSFENGSIKPPKKMNLGLIIGIIVAVAIIGIGTFMFLGNKNNDKDEGQTNTVANEDYFEWSLTDDTMIVGYTEEGLKQTELVIPKKD